jgi:hypothetical protein
LLSFAQGVGHICTAVSKLMPVLLRFSFAKSGPATLALGVGHNPASVPLVRSANVVRSHNSPARIIPHLGKVTEDHGKSSLNKQWAVFHEDEARSNFTDNARHLAPQS